MLTFPTVDIAMESLPPEILTQVIFDLGDDEYHEKGTLTWTHGRARKVMLAPYSTISQAWNVSIERLVFRTLGVTTDELDTFVAISANRAIRVASS
jgi:hypothetical protein